jgi:hypothetical protein
MATRYISGARQWVHLGITIAQGYMVGGPQGALRQVRVMSQACTKPSIFVRAFFVARHAVYFANKSIFGCVN